MFFFICKLRNALVLVGFLCEVWIVDFVPDIHGSILQLRRHQHLSHCTTEKRQRRAAAAALPKNRGEQENSLEKSLEKSLGPLKCATHSATMRRHGA